MHPLAVKRKVMFAKRKLQKQRPAAVSDSIQQLKIMKSTENRHNGHCYCKICLEEFTSKEAYNRHVQEKHLAGWKVNLAKVDDGVSLSDLEIFLLLILLLILLLLLLILILCLLLMGGEF